MKAKILISLLILALVVIQTYSTSLGNQSLHKNTKKQKANNGQQQNQSYIEKRQRGDKAKKQRRKQKTKPSPHIEAITVTEDEIQTTLAADNYNFEDYYQQLSSVVQQDLKDIQEQYDIVKEQCDGFQSDILSFEGQIKYYKGYNDYSELKIEENLQAIENAFSNRCESHTVFIDSQKNAKVTLRLLNFLESALGEYSLVQLKQVGNILNRYIGDQIVKNSKALKMMIQELQAVNSQQFDPSFEVEARTEEEIGTGHIDKNTGDFEVNSFKSGERDGSLEEYKKALIIIIEQLRQQVNKTLSQRQDMEIDMNDKTSVFVISLETDNAFLAKEIEKNKQALKVLEQELSEAKNQSSVCEVDYKWLKNVKESQISLVDSVVNQKDVQRDIYNYFWSVRPDLWTPSCGKIFDLENYEGYGLKIPQIGYENFQGGIVLEILGQEGLKGGIIQVDSEYNVLDYVDINKKQTMDRSLVFSENSKNGLENALIKLGDISKDVVRYFVILSHENGNFSANTGFKLTFYIENVEFSNYTVPGGDFGDLEEGTSYFVLEIYKNEADQDLWYIVPAEFFSVQEDRDVAGDGIQETLKMIADRDQHGDGKETGDWEASDRAVNVRNYKDEGIKIPFTGLGELFIGFNYEAEINVLSGVITVDKQFETLKTISQNYDTQDKENQISKTILQDQFIEYEDSEQYRISLAGVQPTVKSIYVVTSVDMTANNFGLVNKQQINVYIGGKTFTYLTTLPAQNYDATDARSYIGFRLYRNHQDNNEWYLQQENTWLDFNLDGNEAVGVQSEAVKRTIRNEYWDVNFLQFGKNTQIPQWGLNQIEVVLGTQLDQEVPAPLYLAAFALDSSGQQVLEKVNYQKKSDNVTLDYQDFGYSQSISVDYQAWPSEYEKIVFVVYIGEAGEIFDNMGQFDMQVYIGGSKFMQQTGIIGESQQNIFIAFQIEQGGEIVFRDIEQQYTSGKISDSNSKEFEEYVVEQQQQEEIVEEEEEVVVVEEKTTSGRLQFNKQNSEFLTIDQEKKMDIYDVKQFLKQQNANMIIQGVNYH